MAVSGPSHKVREQRQQIYRVSRDRLVPIMCRHAFSTAVFLVLIGLIWRADASTVKQVAQFGSIALIPNATFVAGGTLGVSLSVVDQAAGGYKVAWLDSDPRRGSPVHWEGTITNNTLVSQTRLSYGDSYAMTYSPFLTDTIGGEYFRIVTGVNETYKRIEWNACNFTGSCTVTLWGDWSFPAATVIHSMYPLLLTLSSPVGMVSFWTYVEPTTVYFKLTMNVPSHAGSYIQDLSWTLSGLTYDQNQFGFDAVDTFAVIAGVNASGIYVGNPFNLTTANTSSNAPVLLQNQIPNSVCPNGGYSLGGIKMDLTQRVFVLIHCSRDPMSLLVWDSANTMFSAAVIQQLDGSQFELRRDFDGYYVTLASLGPTEYDIRTRGAYVSWVNDTETAFPDYWMAHSFSGYGNTASTNVSANVTSWIFCNQISNNGLLRNFPGSAELSEIMPVTSDLSVHLDPNYPCQSLISVVDRSGGNSQLFYGGFTFTSDAATFSRGFLGIVATSLLIFMFL